MLRRVGSAVVPRDRRNVPWRLILGWMAAFLVLNLFMMYLLVTFGFRGGLFASIGLGFLTIATGFLACNLISRRFPFQSTVWAATYSFVPMVFVPFSVYEFVVNDNGYSLAFWTTFALSTFCASMLGSYVGVRVVAYHDQFREDGNHAFAPPETPGC